MYRTFHAQQMRHYTIEAENKLVREIRQIYCGQLSVRRNQVMLLANMNGILAAQALNMKECEKIQGIGSTQISINGRP